MLIKTSNYYPHIYYQETTLAGRAVGLSFFVLYCMLICTGLALLSAEIILPPLIILGTVIIFSMIARVQRRVSTRFHRLSTYFHTANYQLRHEIDTEYFATFTMDGAMIKVPFTNIRQVERTPEEYRLYGDNGHLVAALPISAFESGYAQEQFEMILRGYRLL